MTPPLGVLHSAVARGLTRGEAAMRERVADLPPEVRAVLTDDVLRMLIETGLRVATDEALAWLVDQQGVRVGVRVNAGRVAVEDSRP